MVTWANRCHATASVGMSGAFRDGRLPRPGGGRPRRTRACCPWSRRDSRTVGDRRSSGPGHRRARPLGAPERARGNGCRRHARPDRGARPGSLRATPSGPPVPGSASPARCLPASPRTRRSRVPRPGSGPDRVTSTYMESQPEPRSGLPSSAVAPRSICATTTSDSASETRPAPLKTQAWAPSESVGVIRQDRSASARSISSGRQALPRGPRRSSPPPTGSAPAPGRRSAMERSAEIRPRPPVPPVPYCA